MPLENRNFDQLIDFTRTSAATFVNSSGNIASTPQSRNLLTFTNEFANAAWTKTHSAIIPNQNPASASAGSELVTNGGFAGGTTGWISVNATQAVVGGELEVTQTGVGARSEQYFPTVIGRSYVVTAQVRVGTAASATVTVNEGSGAYAVLGSRTVTSGTLTTVTFYFMATTASTLLQLSIPNVAGVTAYFDNISARELVGGALQAPDGTFTADTLVANAGTSLTPRVADTSNPTTINAAAYTASMYVKAGTYTFFQIYLNNQSSEWVNFTLTGAGTASANGSCTATITALSGGWYRCTMSYTAGGTDRRPFFMMAASGSATRGQAWNPAGTETIFLWGAQLEQASAATDYTRNFGGLFPPRFDYDPVTRAPRGLLIEEQRTNLLTYSEQFDNAAWTKGGATVTANSTTSPDGTVDADTLTEDTSTGDHRTFQTVTVSNTTAYAFSVFVKPNGRSLVTLTFSGVGEATYNVSTGVVTNTALGTAEIQNAGNGWYRCILRFTTATTSYNAQIRLVSTGTTTSYTGDGTSGIFVYGAQLEAGAFATSYIPTVASQVTRSRDEAGINAPNFASWYNQSEGTILVEAVTFKPTSVVATGLAVDVSDGGVNNRHYIGTNGATAEGRTVVGGVTQVSIFQTYTANATEKLAYAYKVNDFAFFRNGSQVGTDTSGTIPTVDRMFIGNAAGTAAFWNGWLRSIRYYPTRLTQAQGQALTA